MHKEEAVHCGTATSKENGNEALDSAHMLFWFEMSLMCFTQSYRLSSGGGLQASNQISEGNHGSSQLSAPAGSDSHQDQLFKSQDELKKKKNSRAETTAGV
ncbi:unnamed protein product [Pleuronectes platessa]|uniref:Uncharacterized protein n=1 Tax=Pleuronectes platessa TaxID=8262 RepID=A0A9N7Z7C7_PLEPL|nr:unnamed protein product [Pleuronectes platessa]